MIAEGEALGQPVYQKPGILDFDYFFKTTAIMHKYTTKATMTLQMVHVNQRREALKAADGHKAHAELIEKFEEVKNNTKQAIMVSLYVALGITQKVFQMTQKLITHNHHIFVAYNENNKKACMEGNPIEPKEMTRDQVLDCVLFQE